jgi:hypothetical protein
LRLFAWDSGRASESPNERTELYDRGDAKASRRRDLVEAKRLLFREPKLDFVDDGPGTPVSIQKVIGRRPLLAFGRRRSK